MKTRCSTRSGPRTRWRRACSTSTCTSCTRSPARRPSRGSGWPVAPSAGPTARSPPPTTTCPTDGTPVAARIRDELSRVQVEALERQLRGVRHPRLLDGLRPPGDRARDRARARRHPARHDDRLRRLPHRHARRVRRARVRDRHERGRARARHPDARPAQAALDGHPLRGRARLRRHRQGPDPRHDRPDGHRRRRRPRRRVRRPGDRGALDGGPDDGLQHDDRGRRPRRA